MLALRLARNEAKGPSQESREVEVNNYLLQTASVEGKERPTLADAYAKAFNNVDRFNRLLGAVSYKPRKLSAEWCFFCAVVQIAIVQSWALGSDWKDGATEEEEYGYVREWAQAMATLLIK